MYLIACDIKEGFNPNLANETPEDIYGYQVYIYTTNFYQARRKNDCVLFLDVVARQIERYK